MRSSMAEGSKQPGSLESVTLSGSGNGGGVASPWRRITARYSPKSDAVVSSTPTQSVPALAAAEAQQTRSPNVTTHQPYRDVPSSVFGVETELQGYTGIDTENVLTVKPSYKSVISRTPGHGVTGMSSLMSGRPLQRSPIAGFENNGTQLGRMSGLCGCAGVSSVPQGLMNGNGVATYAGATTTGVALTRPTSICGMSSNRRIVSLDREEHDRDSTDEIGRCPDAFRIVEAEEKHLNYANVELPPADINVGDTAERMRRLHQRRRQVQYGKETLGYRNYLTAVPNRCDREFHNPMHPITPRPEYDCSKRTFDRYLNTWRRQLHLWDNYNPHNPETQYERIGNPTLRELGLELSPNTPEGHPGGALLSFTPMAPAGGVSACTPVTTRQTRRDATMSGGPYQRSAGHPQCGAATSNMATGALPASISVISTTRPLSSCGVGLLSLSNTPHTPYHGSTHSTSSHPPPLVSVLEQPSFLSPHWASSSHQSSPNQHGGQRNGCYPCHAPGAGSSLGATTGGGVGVSANAQGNPGFWEGGGYYYHNNSNNNNSAGHPFRNYGSPFSGHRYTPHHHYPYCGGAGNVYALGNNGGNVVGSSQVYGSQELWLASQKQLHQ